MAGIPSMFQMLNQSVGQAPGLSTAADSLLNQGSMYGARTLGQFMPEGGPSAEQMMTPEARNMSAQQALAGVDYNNPDSIEQVAQQLMQAGRMQEAQQLMSRAQAIRAKGAAVLEAGNQGIQEQAARTKQRAQKFQAKQLALRNGDQAMADAIGTGTVSPEQYMTMELEKKKLYELSRGEMLTDKDGNVIRLNPYTFDPNSGGGGSGQYSAQQKKWHEYNEKHAAATARVTQTQQLIDNIQKTDSWKAGAYADVGEWMAKTLGRRGDEEILRTEYIGVKDLEALKRLPPGPASDRDVEIVRQGVPPSNAGKDEVIRYLTAVNNLSQHDAAYNAMLKDHTIRGDLQSFDAAWEEYRQTEADKQRKEATPDTAIQRLQENPNLRDDFLQMYGWLPEGF
jgi:hypothetical protein